MQTESIQHRTACSAPLLQTAAILVLLLATTVLVRLPGIARPLLGNFATKMTIHGMMARNWINGTAPAWEPTIDCLRDGRPGLHLVEVPLSAYVSGALWQLCGGSLDLWGRLTSIVCSALSVLLLYYLARRWHGARVALVAALVLAFSPVSIIYGQGFMLEPSIVFLTLAAWLAFDTWLERRSAWLWPIWVAALAALFLTKIYMLVLLLPFVALLWQQRMQRDVCLPWFRSILGVLLAMSPALCWCAYVMEMSDPAHPRSASVHYSLAHSAAANGWPHPLLGNPAYYAQILTSLATVVLTPLPLLLFAIAFRHPAWRRHAIWLASMVILIAALPRKFDELNYYYLVVVPPLAIMVGLGYEWCLERWQPRAVWIGLAVVATLLCSLRYTVRPAFVTPAADRSVVAAAEALRKLTSPQDQVITMHGSTVDLLYYCNRRGWAVSPHHRDLAQKLLDCRRQGAQFFVVADVAQAKQNAACSAVFATLPLVVAGDDYRIYRLDGVAALVSKAEDSTADELATAARLAERPASSNTPHAPGTR